MEFLIVKMFSRHELKLTGEIRNPLEPWHSYETAKKIFQLIWHYNSPLNFSSLGMKLELDEEFSQITSPDVHVVN